MLHAMPMFNTHIHMCQLCTLSPVVKFSVCNDCWKNLSWLKKDVIRQDFSIWAACTYDYPLDRIIQQFKYQQQLHYQSLLSGILAQVHYHQIQAIIPMPISTARLIERGFNQSILIAQDLSQKLRAPLWHPILRTAHHTQKGLTRQERLSGITQQFYIDPKNILSFKRVLIVDDVVTTGSSIHALKNQLESLGCQHIRAACLAIAKH